MTETRGLTVNFRPEDFDAIDDAAWDHKMSKNEFIRYCIAEYFERSGNDRITVSYD